MIRQSSLLVRKLLDKLSVVCPNSGYCDQTMQRSVLEQHLNTYCPGTYVECPHKQKGCEYNEPRYNLEDHLWTCGYASDRSRDGTPLPLVEEQVTVIVIPKGTSDLGLKLKPPGSDVSKNGVLIEEIFLGGNAAKDGRLRPGDIIMKVNDTEVSGKSLAKAALVLGSLAPVIRLTVFRPPGVQSDYAEIEVIEIKRSLRQTLGLRIMARKHHEGVFVLGVQPGSPAEQTHRLCSGDRLLEINGVDTKRATVDVVAQLLTEASENVRLVVGRMHGSISKSEFGSNSTIGSSNQYDVPRVNPVSVGEGKTVHIRKDPGESFGMSIAGGLQSECGDLPVFITNVITDGPVGRTRKVKKGDILLGMNNIDLVRKTHTEAVQIIKSLAATSFVQLRMIQGEESANNVLPPEWKEWVKRVYLDKRPTSPGSPREPLVIVLKRPNGGSLGFSIVGGRNSPKGDSPVFIKSLAPRGLAEQDGRIQCGDELLAVNGITITNCTQQEVVNIIKQLTGDVAVTILPLKSHRE